MSYIVALYERTKYWNLTKLDQYVTEMMITTGNKFSNFPASGFLIILQNANMIANGKVNCVMSPYIEWYHSLDYPTSVRWQHVLAPQIHLVDLCSADVAKRATLSRKRIETD